MIFHPKLFVDDYNFYCVRGTTLFDCMNKIKENKADLMTLDSSLAVYASELSQLRPIAAENYAFSNKKDEAILHYYGTVVMKTAKPKSINNLRQSTVCSAGKLKKLHTFDIYKRR